MAAKADLLGEMSGGESWTVETDTVAAVVPLEDVW
jgi:hypothetical protein